MTMTYSEAFAVEREPIEVGKSYTFYCTMQQEYEPPEARFRNYTGQSVTVWQVLSDDEHDPEGGKAFAVRAEDGFRFTALEEELNGWFLDTGQYFWPDGTWGPDHAETFLPNERNNA